MARWQPNPSERLARAALDLFELRGYDETTVIDIAERAGLTESASFRHFPDKREVLFGGGTMIGLLVAGIAALKRRGAPDLTAFVASDVAALTLKIAMNPRAIRPTARRSARSRGERSMICGRSARSA